MAKGKIDFEKSFYIKKMKENSSIWAWSIMLALLCTLISYPGIWYSDSYGRVDYANVVLSCGWKVLTGQRSSISAQSWVTIIPSFFMAASKAVTGNVVGYTCLQAFAFFAATFLFIKKLNTPYRKFQYILFGISPMIWCVSVYYEAGIGCVSGIVALILLLDAVKVEKTGFDHVIEGLLLIFASFVTFGYRANAFTVLPIIVVFVLMSQYRRMKKIVVLGMVLLGFALVAFLPWLLRINTMSSSSAGFAWEIITVIQRLEPEGREQYIDYLDGVGGVGSTALAIETSDEYSVNGFLWGDGLNTGTLSAPGASSTVLKKYIGIMLREPSAYMGMKWDFTKKTLGIGEDTMFIAYDYNQWDIMANYGFNDCVQRKIFVSSYHKINEIIGFYTCHPWLVFLISIVLVLATWLKKDEKRGIYLFALMLAIFYYGAYIINTQSFELRYFYPSLYLMMILDVAIEMKFVRQAFEVIKEKRGKE